MSEINSWKVEYNNFDAEKEPTRETLLAIGNGYFGSRGALEEFSANETNYPGTYVVGLYNRLQSKVADRMIENEDFVNIPNWLIVSLKIEDEAWLEIKAENIQEIHRSIDFKTGELTKRMVIEDDKGRKTEIKSSRFACMNDFHLACMKYSVTPLNYSGFVTLRTGIDGDIINDGVKRYRQLNQQHLEVTGKGEDENVFFLKSETVQSKIEIVQAAKCAFFTGDQKIEENRFESAAKSIYQLADAYLEQGNSLSFEKSVVIYTSKEDDSRAPFDDAMKAAKFAPGYDQLFETSQNQWSEIWDKTDIKITGDDFSQMLLRLHIYHLLVTISPNHVYFDAGIPARGLHGEAYRGHIFWDELYIMPFYYMHFPEVAKSILEYRCRRLDKARGYAKEYGYKGAMFPWQSGSDGREETQIIHLNPLSGEWGDDYSSLQRHISIAVAYNTYMYYHFTGDKAFMAAEGGEVFLEICRFLASMAEFDPKTGRYSVSKVMGPDEFHEMYPGADQGGLKDNAYTNIMIVWLMQRAAEMIKDIDLADVMGKIALSETEIAAWKKMTEKMHLGINDEGIIEQFEGYFKLAELDWEAYRKKYDNIHRMDRILKVENKSVDDYKCAKQADTLMPFYVLKKEDIDDLLSSLGYDLGNDYLEKNYHYYIQRTSHGSTLSRVVHAKLANTIGDNDLCWKLYADALKSDFDDIQGGTTGEGIHAGVMGGTVIDALRTFAGIDFFGENLAIHPNLPEKWTAMEFSILFREVWYNIKIQKEGNEHEVEVEITESIEKQIDIVVNGEKKNIEKDKKQKF